MGQSNVRTILLDSGWRFHQRKHWSMWQEPNESCHAWVLPSQILQPSTTGLARSCNDDNLVESRSLVDEAVQLDPAGSAPTFVIHVE